KHAVRVGGVLGTVEADAALRPRHPPGSAASRPPTSRGLGLDQRSERSRSPGPAGVGLLRSGSRLERVLRSGRFAVTAELSPPDSADPEAVYDRALVLASVC